MYTAKEQFLLNWDEGHDNPDHDDIPTQMEKGLEKVILEAQQQVKNLNIPDVIKSVCPACGYNRRTISTVHYWFCEKCKSNGRTVL